jgi:hypothetical protein
MVRGKPTKQLVTKDGFGSQKDGVDSSPCESNWRSSCPRRFYFILEELKGRAGSWTLTD